MTDKCSCSCGRDAVPHKDRSDLSATCRKRWVDKGRPPGPVLPPFGHAARNLDGQQPEAAPDGTCGCGHCGMPAARPAHNPFISEQCYRRSLNKGLGGYAFPPPKIPRTRKDGKPPREPDPPKPAPEPQPQPATVVLTAEHWAGEAATRVAQEAGRAHAYTTAWARRDYRGVEAVCDKVKDLDAFDALLDAGLDTDKAQAALAGQLAGKFPDRQQHEEETAAA